MSEIMVFSKILSNFIWSKAKMYEREMLNLWILYIVTLEITVKQRGKQHSNCILKGAL